MDKAILSKLHFWHFGNLKLGSYFASHEGACHSIVALIQDALAFDNLPVMAPSDIQGISDEEAILMSAPMIT